MGKVGLCPHPWSPWLPFPKCDHSPGLYTGTRAFPAPCPPQDPSWLCGKRREGIGREQRVPERFLEAIPLLASSLSPPRNAGRIQSGFLLRTPPSQCAASILCCLNSQPTFPLLSSLSWSSQPSFLACLPLPRFPKPLPSLSFLLCPPSLLQLLSTLLSCPEVALDDLQPSTLGILNPKFKIQHPGKPREGEKVLLTPTFLRTRPDFPIKPSIVSKV